MYSELVRLVTQKQSYRKNIGNIIIIILFIFAFCIPDCFMNRHITTGVFGLATISLIISLSLFFLKVKKNSIGDLIITLLIFLIIIHQVICGAISTHNFIYIISSLLLIIIINKYHFRNNMIRTYYFVAITASLLMALWGIAQYLKLITGYNNVAITGSFDNPTGIGIFLSALFPFCMYYIDYKNKYKAYAICVAILIITAILLSQSRTALLSIIVIGFIKLYPKLKMVKFIKRKSVAILVVVSCFLLCLFFLYCLKIDSANGRLLIWKVGMKMFYDNWLFGIGGGSFQSEYMLYQAEYFNQNPESVFTMIADNVLHPFNEYLKFAIEYGIIGLSIFFMYIYFIISQYWKHKSNTFIAPVFLSIFIIGVGSFFSYPLRYPSIGVILIINLTIINSLSEARFGFRNDIYRYILNVLMIIYAIFMVNYIPKGVSNELKWCKTIKYSLFLDKTHNIDLYDSLHNWFKNDGLFLYNYSAELNYTGKYNESNIILSQCSKIFNDIDVQLLIADNYINLENYSNAEYHLQLASNMCPVRFMPLYKLFLMHIKNGNNDKAISVGNILLNKEIKVPSELIVNIMIDVKKKIAELDLLN